MNDAPRSSRRVLVSGASIAGLSAAWWLARAGWDVTVIEKADEFREGGQNVDLRGVAHEVLSRMGLTDAVRAMNTGETGTVLVNRDNSVIAELPSDGPDGATAELEILRGDLARILRDDLPDAVRLRFGDEIVGVDDRGATVAVKTRGGTELRAELLVVAEGVRSHTRDLVFAGSVGRTELDIAMAFGTIPRVPTDDSRWRWYNAVGGRQAHLRPDNHGTTRAVLAYDRTSDLSALGREEALRVIRDRFAGAGWETARILDGFDASDDMYIDQLTQIRMPTWHRGRVCLVGDAAWCVTPLGGGGASLALIAGYVLTAYLSKAVDVDAPLSQYEAWMRPLVDAVQKLPPALHPLAYPKTAIGLKARSLVMKVLTSRPLSTLLKRMTKVADTRRPLPELA